MIYARSNMVESNPRYQAAVAEQRRREKAKIAARIEAIIAEPKPKPDPITPTEQIRKFRRERDREMFEAAAQRFPLPETIKITSVKDIMAQVASEHGVTLNDILGQRRTRKIMLARREAVYRVWTEKSPIGLAEVGRHFGLDHTTVLHALRKMGVTSTLNRAMNYSSEAQHE